MTARRDNSGARWVVVLVADLLVLTLAAAL